MVFLSYRHENEEHQARVRELAIELREAGVDVVLDQFYFERNRGGPDEGWPVWSAQQVKNASRVLIVASPGWFRCFEKKEVSGKGLGAACEAHVIYQSLYERAWRSDKFRIVVVATSGDCEAPAELRGYHEYRAERKTDMNDALAWLGHPRSGKSAPASKDAWLDTPPNVMWPFADGEDVRDAFAGLLSSPASYRALFIRGGSETGKTKMTMHMAELAMRLPWLSCGRINLKGGTELGKEWSRFCEHQIGPEDSVEAVVGAGSASERLRKLYRFAERQARPCLWIMDTYDDEHAADLTDWLTTSLLPSLVRAGWLRLIIAGQKVPAIAGAPWAEDVKFIEVKPASCDDWVRCGTQHWPGLEVSKIHTAYELARGKASLLWQMLGPQPS